MAEPKEPTPAPGGTPTPAQGLERGTYEIIRQRLATHGAELAARLERLNAERQSVFGGIATNLLATERLTTEHKCVSRDMVPLGLGRFLFGYNVHIGLRAEVAPSDVFSLYELRENQFHSLPLDPLADEGFQADFKSLYRYYRNTVFSKFFQRGPTLHMVFQIGKSVADIKTFKWLHHDGRLEYQGNRSEHEVVFPPQHEVEWKRTHRELHRFGLHPHISIEDRVFVETVGGDLTIKVEDNTESGQGIYAEPVENKDQTLDDAEIFYALADNLILLKIRPYQEKAHRHLVYNQKLQQVRRIDAIQHACVLLPDGQGIMHGRGYYLQTGEFKEFESNPADMLFERRIQSPNGEDHAYVFYNRERGNYTLMPYNVISQRVESPLLCDGFSIFEDGRLVMVRASQEPQKHHVVQIWQTPFIGAGFEAPVNKESHLYKIGNPDLVRCMAECQNVRVLLSKDDSYGNLYVDLVKAAGDIIDSYFWLGDEAAFDLKGPLAEIRKAASAALEEFDKVLRIRRSTAEAIGKLASKTRGIIRDIPYGHMEEIQQFVRGLAGLREVRGELIAGKDLRYADLALLDGLEKEVVEHSAKLSGLCVEFLGGDQALTPYRERATALQGSILALAKVTEAKRLEEELGQAARELEMLIEVVTNLKIDDSTRAAAIIDAISLIYSQLNQARAQLKQRMVELRGAEASAEFGAQVKLIDQGVVNYLDLCDKPNRCDEYQNKLLVQIEELEGRFADFGEFVIQLSDKRNDVCAAFEARKLALVEQRNRKASALLSAATRILKGIQHRLGQFKTIAEINGYCASDLMVEKVRDIVAQLLDLGDTVKADDLQSRLKTTREEAVRQLKDRQDLFVAGQDLIQFGRHRFTVNTQELELTLAPRDGEMCFHLAGTNYFERVSDPEFLATRAAWGQEVVSENAAVYRGEYLAWLLFCQLEREGRLAEAAKWSAEERLAAARAFMAPRYEEGYLKGVHDHDAARIFGALAELHGAIGLLRHDPAARALGVAFWLAHAAGQPGGEGAARWELLRARIAGFGAVRTLFPNHRDKRAYVAELEGLLAAFATMTGLFPAALAEEGADYLFEELCLGHGFTWSGRAAHLAQAFKTHLHSHLLETRFNEGRAPLAGQFAAQFQWLREWLRGFALHHGGEPAAGLLDETACLWLWQEGQPVAAGRIIKVDWTRTIEGILGSHGRIEGGKLALDFVEFAKRLRTFEREGVPAYSRCQAGRHALVEKAREAMRLDNFKPKVLTSFVRNRLLDKVYLPLIGDNLAKQIGAAGENKRTDRMGMLLLISPPGYGKTTLMEYIASRLGLIFMKINGPSLGEKVTSLDPATAPNAAAREEIEKLNLALEMGDNVMLYLDDIQHCHPEFLQKFISLCDGQRRIEGVYKGRSKTYDLRGKKVAVVMAGNPYTESGEKFKIPDMLANRADTYNLGDIIGGHEEAFKASYLENAAASNPILAPVAGRNPKDIPTLIQLAESGLREGLQFEGNYGAEELQELIRVLRMMLQVRDVLLKVNSEYIHSAAQHDAYRTEPPFKLQGSYRNMSRLAEKIAGIMSDGEIVALVNDHYKNEAQTLATGAESNLLKFRELTGQLTPADAKRWEEIKRGFQKSSLLRGTGGERDPVALVVQQLANFGTGLDSIKDVLAGALVGLKETLKETKPPAPVFFPHPPQEFPPLQLPHLAPPGSSAGINPVVSTEGPNGPSEIPITPETLRRIWELIENQPPTPHVEAPGGEGPLAIRIPANFTPPPKLQ